jgi:hypothetical protein
MKTAMFAVLEYLMNSVSISDVEFEAMTMPIRPLG